MVRILYTIVVVSLLGASAIVAMDIDSQHAFTVDHDLATFAIVQILFCARNIAEPATKE